MSTKATDTFNASRDALRDLLDHDEPDVRLAAKVMLKHRYDEEVSLP